MGAKPTLRSELPQGAQNPRERAETWSLGGGCPPSGGRAGGQRPEGRSRANWPSLTRRRRRSSLLSDPRPSAPEEAAALCCHSRLVWEKTAVRLCLSARATPALG